jgi:hypothetical protein
MVNLYDLVHNLEIALSLFYLIWLYGWSKNALGSAKLAIVFSVIVVWITVWQFPILIWMGVALFLFATFGKELFSKMAKT